MKTVQVLLSESGFSGPFHVEGREAIANVLPKSKRCGIYVLHFKDGMHYIGQSIDVTRRYVEHRRNYNDIVQLSFKQVKLLALDYEERRVRNLFQDNGHVLRGVVGIHPLPGDADFDLIMPLEDQKQWITNPYMIDYSGSRVCNPALRKTFEGKFVRLIKKRFFDDMLEVLRKYMRVGIPRIRASEETFWSCSCLPETYTYTRININWQEVFAIHEGEDELTYTFQFALSPLRHHSLIKDYFEIAPGIPFGVRLDREVCIDSFYQEHQKPLQKAADDGMLDMSDETLDAFIYYLRRCASTSISSYRYTPGGDDQVRFSIEGKDLVLELLDDKTVIRAIRQMNLRLMRLGPSRFKTSHCLSLADLIVEEEQ